jgi:N-methylhydantoinase B
MSGSDRIDPIIREVVQNRLTAIVREMSITLQRASYSPIIYEVKDFSSVLLRPNGDLVAQAEGIPGFLGAMPQLIPPVLERYPLTAIRPGDLFVSNDPYSANGTHKNDVNVIKPLFGDGRIFGFAVNKAHWTDIGGKESGSWSPDATNTFQEGISIPPLRLVEAGTFNEELLEIVLANTRLRENNLGDLMAQISACRTAERRVDSLLARYGVREVEAYVDSLFESAEAKMRSEIEAIPDGVYVGEDYVETDGINDQPIRVSVRISVRRSEIEFDFTDSPPQHDGACGNIPIVGTVSACRLALKCLLAASVNANEGLYRPMSVVTVPGTMMHPVHPAPCTTWGDMMRATIEAIFSALAPVMPEKVIAGIFGQVQAMAIAGEDPRTERAFIHFMPYAGGWGARSSKDGVNALCALANGDNYNIPCEVVEAEFPLVVERYELIQDSGGPGEFRGGLGVRIDYRVLSNGATVSASLDRYLFLPPGRFGGAPGKGSALVLGLGEKDEVDRPKTAGFRVLRGRVISHRTGGGGGFGDPRQRDPARVQADVDDGYVSAESAAQDYGQPAVTRRAASAARPANPSA